MPLFYYKAVTRDGVADEGEMMEANSAAVIRRIQDSGRIPIMAEEMSAGRARSKTLRVPLPRRKSRRLVQRRIESPVLKTKWRRFVTLLPGRNVEPHVPAAVHDHAAMLRSELVVGHVGRDAGSTTEGGQHSLKQSAVGPWPKVNRPLGQRAFRVMQKRGRMGAQLGTQPLARRAPAE